jgi:2-polyprenyl-6-hydroxyphenyl methylase/3-demethylubiquinone-9 3-methyltransferase
MKFLLLAPMIIQGLFMFVDEFYYHHKRGLPRWERMGHPADTISVLICFLILCLLPYSETNLYYYIAACAFSCVLITKDEFVHSQVCDKNEQWLHSMLFVLHPIILFAAGIIWKSEQDIQLLYVQTAIISVFLFYQIIYWNLLATNLPEVPVSSKVEINNQIYNELGERWYTAQDDPVALLRAESRTIVPWVQSIIPAGSKVLDIGCGGGFLTNPMAKGGLDVTAVDVSKESLAIAKKYDSTQTVKYMEADGYHLPFADHTFDVVTCMDMLEHVDRPGDVIKEAARVLKPQGLFFYHTFNRTFLGWFIAIKLVEWFVKNTPKHMHLWRMFITLKEMSQHLKAAGFENVELKGLSPNLGKLRLRDFLSGSVPVGFDFRLSNDKTVTYLGYARKTD